MIIKRFILPALGALLLAIAQSAAAQPTSWNNLPDPYGLYGLCSATNSAIRNKASHVFEVGESLVNVLAITVLNCTAYSGGGGTNKVSCPDGSPYAYCTRNYNDGGGNDILLGILKTDSAADPNGAYTGCPDGAKLQSKLRLIKLANKDPRLLKGIVTLNCGAATQAKQTKPTQVACPSGPNPYSLCLNTPNDGFGNAVTIGVVSTRDQGDAYGLYGECEGAVNTYGILPGFYPKSSLVTGVGRSLASVRTIDLLGCGVPSGMNLPENLHAGSCSEIGLNSAWAEHYNYCIWGTDEKGNGVVAGVNQ